MTLEPPRQIFPRLDKTTTRSKVAKNQKSFPPHLRNIRACCCLICGKDAEAAHIRYSDAATGKANPGVGSRPADFHVVPLCPGHHRLYPDSQHETGDERAWWEGHSLDPIAIAAKLWEARDDLKEMQEIARNMG